MHLLNDVSVMNYHSMCKFISEKKLRVALLSELK